MLLGGMDSAWAARLPAVVAGTLTVLCVAQMAAWLFGPAVGLLAGVALATMVEFLAYATLAEDEVFLALLVAAAMLLFVRAEFAGAAQAGSGFVDGRSWAVAGFFILLGLTNLAKGPLVGAAPVAVALAGFLIWSGWQAVRRYCWLWGWLAFALIALAWPAWALWHVPSVWDNWIADYTGAGAVGGRYDRPAWHYLLTLPWTTLPWTPALIVGLGLCAGAAVRRAGRAERFVLCWAILAVVMLSIPGRKHHHYLVPLLAPWAVLAAVGLARVGAYLRDQGWRRPGVALVCFVGVWAAGYGWVQSQIAARRPEAVGVVAFLREVEAKAPADRPLLIDGELILDAFRVGFYLRPDARLVHNLTFLRDRALTAAEVYVVTRPQAAPVLATLGEVERVAQLDAAAAVRMPENSLACFRVRFREDLVRYPAPPPASVTVLQAMGRSPGPFCGPPF